VLSTPVFIYERISPKIIRSWGTSPQKKFASPALNLKSFKNFGFGGAKLLACPGRTQVSGRPWLREILGRKEEKVTWGWRKCHNEVLLEFDSLGYNVNVGRTLGAYGGEEKCIQCLA
jgi:hypothetical protein